MKRLKKEVAKWLIYSAYLICRVATWIDPSEAPEGGWE